MRYHSRTDARLSMRNRYGACGGKVKEGKKRKGNEGETYAVSVASPSPRL